MTKIHNRTTTMTQRKCLRREMTTPERVIWSLLRGKKLGAKFRRQHSVQEYVLDFYCSEHRLAIEIDGESHFTPEGIAHDKQRLKILSALGIRVLRFTNVEAMKNREGIWQTISESIAKGPLLRGGEV